MINIHREKICSDFAMVYTSNVNQAFAAEKIMSYDITEEKECDFTFHVIYYLCFYDLSIQS